MTRRAGGDRTAVSRAWPLVVMLALLGQACASVGSETIPPGEAGPAVRVATLESRVTALRIFTMRDHVALGWRSADRPGAVHFAWSRDGGASFDDMETRASSDDPVGVPFRWAPGDADGWWRRVWPSRPQLLPASDGGQDEWAVHRVDDTVAEVVPPERLGSRRSSIRVPRAGLRLRWAGPDAQANLVTLWADPARRTVTAFRYLRRGVAHTGSFDVPVVVARDVSPDLPVAAAAVEGGVLVAWAADARVTHGLWMRPVPFDPLCALPSAGLRFEYVSQPVSEARTAPLPVGTTVP